MNMSGSRCRLSCAEMSAQRAGRVGGSPPTKASAPLTSSQAAHSRVRSRHKDIELQQKPSHHFIAISPGSVSRTPPPALPLFLCTMGLCRCMWRLALHHIGMLSVKSK